MHSKNTLNLVSAPAWAMLLLAAHLPIATANGEMLTPASASVDLLDDSSLREASLSDEELGDLRGGFEDERFSNFAFSYERITFINDILVEREFVTLPGVQIPAQQGLVDLDVGSFMPADGEFTPGVNDPMVLTDGLTTIIQIVGDNQTVRNFEVFNLELHDVDSQGLLPLVRSAHEGVLDTILNNF